MEVTEKIIWFMLGKAEKVKEICDIEYFTDEDIESIRMLDKDKLKFVWEMIMCYVGKYHHIKIKTFYAFLINSMRTYLHESVSTTIIHHFSQQALNS